LQNPHVVIFVPNVGEELGLQVGGFKWVWIRCCFP